MPDGQARCPAGEATVGQQRTHLPQTTALDVGGGVKHLLHPGATLWPFVANDDDIAGAHDILVEDPRLGRLLALEDPCGTREAPDGLIDAGGLHDAAVLGDVAVENGQAAVGAVRVVDRPHAPAGAVVVEGGPTVWTG